MPKSRLYTVPYFSIPYEWLKSEIFYIYQTIYSDLYKKNKQPYWNDPHFVANYATAQAYEMRNSIERALLFMNDNRANDEEKKYFSLDITGTFARRMALKYLCRINVPLHHFEGSDIDLQAVRHHVNDDSPMFSDADLDDFFKNLMFSVTRNADSTYEAKGSWKHFIYGLTEYSASLQEAADFLISSMHVRINLRTGQFIFRDKASHDFFIDRIINISEMGDFLNAELDLSVSKNKREALDKIPQEARNAQWEQDLEQVKKDFVQVKYYRARLAHFIYSAVELIQLGFTFGWQTNKTLKKVIIKNKQHILYLYNRFLIDKKLKPISLETLIKSLFPHKGAHEPLLQQINEQLKQPMIMPVAQPPLPEIISVTKSSSESSVTDNKIFVPLQIEEITDISSKNNQSEENQPPKAADQTTIPPTNVCLSPLPDENKTPNTPTNGPLSFKQALVDSVKPAQPTQHVIGSLPVTTTKTIINSTYKRQPKTNYSSTAYHNKNKTNSTVFTK